MKICYLKKIKLLKKLYSYIKLYKLNKLKVPVATFFWFSSGVYKNKRLNLTKNIYVNKSFNIMKRRKTTCKAMLNL